MDDISHQTRLHLMEKHKNEIIQEEEKACQAVKHILAKAFNAYEASDGFAQAAKKIGGFIKWETAALKSNMRKEASLEGEENPDKKYSSLLKQWRNKKEPYRVTHEDISVTPEGFANGRGIIRIRVEFHAEVKIVFPGADNFETQHYLRQAGWEPGKKLPGLVKAIGAAMKQAALEVAEVFKVPAKYVERTPKIAMKGGSEVQVSVLRTAGDGCFMIDILGAIAKGEWRGAGAEDKKETGEAESSFAAHSGGENKMKVRIEIPEKIKHKITDDTIAKLKAKAVGVDASIAQLNIKFGNSLIRAARGTFYRGVATGINGEGKKFKVAELRIRYKE